MASFTDEEVAQLAAIIDGQASRVAERYEGVVSDDLAQEVWLWALDTPGADRVRNYLDTGQIGRLKKAAYYESVAWCEKDKRRRQRAAGIDWRDEYNYTRPEVARLLPMALDYGAIPGLTGRDLTSTPGTATDPAYHNDQLASLIDVRNAFGKLSGPDQDYVRIVVGLDCNWADIAATTEIQASSAYAKWMRILDRMVTRHLGRKTDDDE